MYGSIIGVTCNFSFFMVFTKYPMTSACSLGIIAVRNKLKICIDFERKKRTKNDGQEQNHKVEFL